MIKRIHVVFKTHLDIGFTDLAFKTVQRYFDQFIPRAVAVAQKLRNQGGRERLVWTTGSWLIKSYLQESDDAKRTALKEAIEAGDIIWHGLPFTSHTELMDRRLAEYALSLSQELDKQFAKETIAAKMTDVPGHTLALVPLLAKAGIKFLHIGVNGGSPLPEVPRLFRWRAPTGEEIVVQYDETYGSSEPIGDLEDLLVIENSADNEGPPTEEEVLEAYRRLSEQYPDAQIIASDLSAYARSILPFADTLPVIESEIGDTWIHGVGTDPLKVSSLRRLLGWLAQNPEAASNDRFMDRMLLVCEHTWGTDFKKYLADYANWSVEDFHKAREKDLIGPDAITPEYQYIEDFTREEFARIFSDRDTRRERRTYSFFTSAHQEQRNYLKEAVAALTEGQQKQTKPLLERPVAAFKPVGKKSTLAAGQELTIGTCTLSFGLDGSLASYRGPGGVELVGKEGIGAYRYETFSSETYETYHRAYNRNFEIEQSWVRADFGKPGMEHAKPTPQHRLWTVELRSLTRYDGQASVVVHASLAADPESPRGGPRVIDLWYHFSLEGQLEQLRLDWKEKEATRLPEALWLSVSLALPETGTWKMIKLGRPVAMDRTVSKGARSVHAVEGVEYRAGDKVLRISNIDSPLMSIERRKLLCFDDELADVTGTFHFNLYNNIWGTNFPMWYDEDGSTVLTFTGALTEISNTGGQSS